MLDKKIYNKKKIEKLRYEFLPSALEIEETPPSPLGARMILGLTFMLLIAILYSIFSKVDMVAVARGKVIPNGRVKVIQSVEEGIISAIYIDEGDEVKKGDTLLELDRTMKEVDENAILKSIAVLKAEAELLELYLNEKDSGVIKAYISSMDIEEDIKHSLQEFIISKIETLESKKSLLSLSIMQLYSEIALLELQVQRSELSGTLLSENKQILTDMQDKEGVIEAELRKTYLQIGFGEEALRKKRDQYTKGEITEEDYNEYFYALQLLKKEAEVQQSKLGEEDDQNNVKDKQLEDTIKLNKNELAQAQVKLNIMRLKLGEEEEKLSQIEKVEREDVLATIVEKQKKIQEHEVLIEKTKNSLEYQSIKSPVDGTISFLGVNTVGAVLKPSESIASIVPKGTDLVIEAMVLNKDIGFIEENQEVSVKVDAFPFQKYGLLKGRIEKVSADAYEDERYGQVYRIKVRLSRNEKKETINVLESRLLPGMGVTVEVKLGKRRIIDFLIDPFIKNMDEAFKLR